MLLVHNLKFLCLIVSHIHKAEFLDCRVESGLNEEAIHSALNQVQFACGEHLVQNFNANTSCNGSEDEIDKVVVEENKAED